MFLIMPSIESLPLEKRRVIKKTLVNVLKWYTLIAALILFKVLMVNWPYLIALGVVIIGLEYLYQFFAHKNYFFDLQDKILMVREGVIARREKTVPYKNIYDVYVDQDLFDRMFKIWDLHFTTPESRVFNIHIDGLSAQSAMAVRKNVLEKIQ